MALLASRTLDIRKFSLSSRLSTAGSRESCEIQASEREEHATNLGEISLFMPELARTSRALIFLADSKRAGFARAWSDKFGMFK